MPQQGKAYTKEQKQEIIESLKPFLEAGLSRNKSCDAIGLHPTTLSKWVQADEALSMKLQGWENTMGILALANIHSALQIEAEQEDARKETSKWYLERRMKESFSTRTEQTGANGSPLIPDAKTEEKAQDALNSFLDGRQQDKRDTTE